MSKGSYDSDKFSPQVGDNARQTEPLDSGSQESPVEVVPNDWVHPLSDAVSRNPKPQLDKNDSLYDKVPFRMPTPIPGGARMPTLYEVAMYGIRTGIGRRPNPRESGVTRARRIIRSLFKN